MRYKIKTSEILEGISPVYLLIFLITCLFFRDYILYGKLPVTSGDPALRFWDIVYYAKQYQDGIFSLWDPRSSIGGSVFQNDIVATPFSLYAVFLSFFSDFGFGLVIYKWIELLLLAIFLANYLSKSLKINRVLIVYCYTIFIFTPGWLNEYFFNSFGGYIYIPLILTYIDRYLEDKKIIYALVIGFILAWIQFSSNTAVVQFSLIFLTLYYYFMLFQNKISLEQFFKASYFMIILIGTWLLVMSFFLVPFFWENIFNERSNHYGLYGGFSFWLIFKSLLYPFTSWIFFDEKMITTGLLTKFESLSLYQNVILLPSGYLFFRNMKFFSSRERFFFYYALIFLFLGWLNNYIPVLGYFTEITHSTGWWRSLPLYFLSTSIAVSIVINKLLQPGRLHPPVFLKWYLNIMEVIYFAGFSVILSLFIVYKFDETLFIKFLEKFSVRGGRELFQYFNEYYFTAKILIALLIIPIANFMVLHVFRRLIFSNGKINISKSVSVILLSTIFAVLSVSVIFYPFNNGVNKVVSADESKMLNDLDKKYRVVFFINDQNEIEKIINREFSGKEKSLLNFNLRLADFPEISRIQSNVISQGGYLKTRGLSVYTKGNSFTNKNLVEYHMDMIKNNKIQAKKFLKAKYDVRVDKTSLGSPLFKNLSVKYIFSSLPVNNEDFSLFFKGDTFSVYENRDVMPRWYFSDEIIHTDEENMISVLNSLGKENLKMKTVVSDSVNIDIIKGLRKLEIINRKDDGVLFHTKTSSEQLLVFSEAFTDNWRVKIDSMPSKIIRVDHIYMGVVVPSGEHNIYFYYTNSIYDIVKFISLISIGILLIIFFYNRKSILKPFYS